MEFYGKNGMKQVEYCDECFDNKTLFFIFPLHLIQTQFFYRYIVELYRNIVQDILKKEYDFYGRVYGRVF